MYKPEGLALEIFKQRYALTPDESWEQACWRLAQSVASVERPEVRRLWEDRFFDILSKNLFMPGGRIWNGAAKPKGGLLNCFVIEPEDSREGWAKASHDMIVISSLGGGVGMNFSAIRPKGSPIAGTGGYASGPLSLMQLINDNGATVSTGGGRRVALMQCLNADHPDIYDFINSKTFKVERNHDELIKCINNFFPNLVTDTKFQYNLDRFAKTDYGVETLYSFCKALHDTKLNKANISVVMPKGMKELPEDIYDAIIENAYESGDPGILNFDRAEEDNNIAYYGPISATNPCFTGDTKVWTEIGQITFKDLVAKGYKKIRVLSQTKDKKLVYRWMSKPRVTQKMAELVKVHFKNGTSVTCTPNHKIYLKKGGFKFARNLKPSDRISSVYRYVANNKGYLRLTNGAHTPLEHHVPFEKGVPDGFSVHHIDGVKANNCVDNLELLPTSLHNSMHMLGDNNPVRRFPDRNWLTKQDHSGTNNGRYRHDIAKSAVEELKNSGLSIATICQKLGVSKTLVKNRLQAENHIVSHVEKLTIREDVYCGTVEDTGVFFVAVGENEGILVSNCGEIPMTKNEVCCLGSLVLPRAHASGRLPEIVDTAVRFLDNVIDVTNYPTPEIEVTAKSLRRVGLGVLGYHDLLLHYGISYSSQGKYNLRTFTEGLAFGIMVAAYNSSLSLGREKGAFKHYNSELFWNNGFAKKFYSELDVGRYLPDRIGIRNCALLSIAPTGTISMVCGVSSGIEPIFSIAYKRRYYEGDRVQMETVYNPLYKEFKDKGKSTAHFETSSEISLQAQLAVQAVWQKYFDQGISKTLNIPNNFDINVLKYEIKEWLPKLKGVTIYRAGSKGGEPLEDISCPSGVCDI